MKIRPKNLRLPKNKFHPARGRGPIRGWLVEVFVEHKITLVVEPRGRSLVIVPYGTMAAVESTSIISVLYTAVEVWSFLVACGKSFTTWLESDPTRRLWALPSLDNTF